MLSKPLTTWLAAAASFLVLSLDHPVATALPEKLSSHVKSSTPIEHVVVLMLENRAFDHLLGSLALTNDEVDGCIPSTCSSPLDPTLPASPRANVTFDAVYSQLDPCHSISCTTKQVYSYNTSTPMDGFIKNYAEQTSDQENVSIQDQFSAEHLPATTTLANEFAVFDRWYASVPGPTMVNRAYAASATSHGMGTNNPIKIGLGLPQETMFSQLNKMGLKWSVYFSDVPSVLQQKDMRFGHLRNYHGIKRFADDAKGGKLPEFTWVEPAYFDSPEIPATDQHPDHDVSAGDSLIKYVYDSLRSSPKWNNTVLMITYDEHGGFPDHVLPPDCPNPDGMNSTDDPFDFKRLGVRIPTIVASPLIAKSTVVHRGEGEGEYEHSSIIKTVVHDIFSSKTDYSPEFLTKRDEWASSFASVFTLDEPRVDCPLVLPDVPSHREQFPETLPPLDGMMPLSELQKELLAVVKMLETDKCKPSEFDVEALETEIDGLRFAEERIAECVTG